MRIDCKAVVFQMQFGEFNYLTQEEIKKLLLETGLIYLNLLFLNTSKL